MKLDVGALRKTRALLRRVTPSSAFNFALQLLCLAVWIHLIVASPMPYDTLWHWIVCSTIYFALVTAFARLGVVAVNSLKPKPPKQHVVTFPPAGPPGTILHYSYSDTYYISDGTQWIEYELGSNVSVELTGEMPYESPEEKLASFRVRPSGN